MLSLVNEVGQRGKEIDHCVTDTLTEIHPNLFVLPSGGKTRAATEMLEHDDFSVVIESLKKNAEVIIIDSPPIGLFPDSLAIARKVEEVLFVTRVRKSFRKVVKSLIGSIKETGVNLLGVVLNDLPQKKTPVTIIQAIMVTVISGTSTTTSTTANPTQRKHTKLPYRVNLQLKISQGGPFACIVSRNFSFSPFFPLSTFSNP